MTATAAFLKAWRSITTRKPATLVRLTLVPKSGTGTRLAFLSQTEVATPAGTGQAAQTWEPMIERCDSLRSPGSFLSSDANLVSWSFTCANRKLGFQTAPVAAYSNPQNGILDDFNRANGALTSPWVAAVGSASVTSNQASAAANADYYWDPIFGADQEVTVKVPVLPTSGGSFALFLKGQSAGASAQRIYVYWQLSNPSTFYVYTFNGTSSTLRGTVTYTLVANDQISARCDVTGLVSLYANGVLKGTVDVSAWPQFNLGGRIGLNFGNSALRFDDFGGGTVAPIAASTDPGTLISALKDYRFDESAVVELFLWEQSLTSFNDALKLYTGRIFDYVVEDAKVTFYTRQRTDWNRPVQPLIVTRSQYPRAPDGVIGQSVPIVYGSRRALPMRAPWASPYGVEQRIREIVAGGRRVSPAVLVDTGRGNGSDKAKVLVASHRVKQLGANSPNYGTSPFLKGDDGKLHVIDPPSGDIFLNATDGAGFYLDDRKYVALQPLFPNEVVVVSNMAKDPRHALDWLNEQTFAILDVSLNYLELRLALPAVAPKGQYASGLDSFAYVLYRTSAGATGLTFAFHNSVGAGTSTTLPATTTPAAYNITSLGTDWGNSDLPSEPWDFSDRFLRIFFSGGSGSAQIMLSGMFVPYRPQRSMIESERVLPTTTRRPTRRTVRGHGMHTRGSFGAYDVHDVIPSVTELNGQFWTNVDGWPDATGDFTGAVDYSALPSFFAWTRYTLSSTTGVVAVHKLGPLGAIVGGWTVPVTAKAGTGTQSLAPDVDICTDLAGDGCFVAACVYNSSPGFTQGYAVKLDSTGAPAAGWGAMFSAGTPTGHAAKPFIVGDGSGGCFIVWVYTAGSVSLVAQKFNSSGAKVWATDGVTVDATTYSQSGALFAYPDGTGGLYIGWLHNASGTTKAYVIRLDSSGVLASGWPAGGRDLGTTSTVTTQSTDGGQSSTAGSMLVALTAVGAISERTVDSAGVASSLGPDVLPSSSGSPRVAAVGDEAGGLLIAYVDTAATPYKLYLTRVNAVGTETMTRVLLHTYTTTINMNIKIQKDGTGGAVVAWDDRDAPGPKWRIHVKRVLADGTLAWPGDAAITTYANDYTIRTMTTDGAGGAIIAWQVAAAGLKGDMYAQRVNRDGATMWGAGGVLVSADATSERFMTAAAFTNAPHKEIPAGSAMALDQLIQRAPDIASHILATYGGQTLAQIERATSTFGSFVDARARLKTWRQGDMIHTLTIGDRSDVMTALAWLAQSSGSWCVLSPFDDKWKWHVWDRTAAVNYAWKFSRYHIHERNGPRCEKTPTSEIAAGVRVLYGYDYQSRQLLHEASIGSGVSLSGHAYYGLRDGSLRIVTGVNDVLNMYKGGSAATVILAPGSYATGGALAQAVAAALTLLALGSDLICIYCGEIIAGFNDQLVIKDGATKTVTLTPGVYTMEALAAHVQAQLNASSSLWTCTYSRTTRKFTISRSSSGTIVNLSTVRSIYCLMTLGIDRAAIADPTTFPYTGQREVEERRFLFGADAALDLMCLTGADVARSAFPALGFDGGYDHKLPGVISWLSDTPKTRAEEDLALQVTRFNPKRDLVIEARAIDDTDTAMELRDRLIGLAGRRRTPIQFTTEYAPDLDRGHVVECDTDMNELIAYPDEDSDGSWVGKSFVVTETEFSLGPIDYGKTVVGFSLG